MNPGPQRPHWTFEHPNNQPKEHLTTIKTINPVAFLLTKVGPDIGVSLPTLRPRIAGGICRLPRRSTHHPHRIPLSGRRALLGRVTSPERWRRWSATWTRCHDRVNFSRFLPTRRFPTSLAVATELLERLGAHGCSSNFGTPRLKQRLRLLYAACN